MSSEGRKILIVVAGLGFVADTLAQILRPIKSIMVTKVGAALTGYRFDEIVVLYGELLKQGPDMDAFNRYYSENLMTKFKEAGKKPFLLHI